MYFSEHSFFSFAFNVNALNQRFFFLFVGASTFSIFIKCGNWILKNCATMMDFLLKIFFLVVSQKYKHYQRKNSPNA